MFRTGSNNLHGGGLIAAYQRYDIDGDDEETAEEEQQPQETTSAPEFDEDEATLAPLDAVDEYLNEFVNETNAMYEVITNDTETNSSNAKEYVGNIADGSETLPPHIFNNGTFSPDYFEDFTLHPDIVDEDLPWFVSGGTVAPELYEGGTLPPWLMDGGTFAPGLVDDGEIDGGYLADEWADEGLPGIEALELDNGADAAPVFREDPFVEYERRAAATNFGRLPRFGNPHEFSSLGYLLTEDHASEGEDYISGFLYLVYFFLGYFFFWFLWLLLFKFCSSGIFSGKAFAVPVVTSEDAKETTGKVFSDPAMTDEDEKKTTDDTKDTKEIEALKSSVNKQGSRVRLVFLVAGISQIAAVVLLSSMGLPSLLQDTTGVVQNTAASVKELIAEAEDAAWLLRSSRDLGYSLQTRIEHQAKEAMTCPGIPDFKEAEVGSDVQKAVDSTLDKLKELQRDFEDGLDTLESGLINQADFIDSLEEATRTVKDNGVYGYICVIPYIVVTTLMLGGVVTAHRNTINDRFECFLSWVLLPILVLLTVLSVGLCTALFVSATINADFCGGAELTPDETIVNLIVNSEAMNQDDTAFILAEYYLFQCTERASEDALLFLRQGLLDVEAGSTAYHNFTSGFTEVLLDKYNFVCQSDFTPLFDSIDEIQNLLSATHEILNSMFKLMKCERISAVATELLYKGACTYSISGFAWSASCLLVMAVTGMIMITLRSSYLKTPVLDTEAGEESSGAGPTTMDDDEALGGFSDNDTPGAKAEGGEARDDSAGARSATSNDGEAFECPSNTDTQGYKEEGDKEMVASNPTDWQRRPGLEISAQFFADPGDLSARSSQYVEMADFSIIPSLDV